MLDIIDVSGLKSGDAGAIARIGAELGRACREVGFFYVRNHGIPDALLSGIFTSARAFFASPRAEKDELSIARSPHNRGYAGLASESLDQVHADNKEAFNVGLDLSRDDPEVAAGKPFRGVNVWPATPGFRDTALAYFNAVWRLGCDLHEAIAVDLKLPRDYFADKLDRPMATLRLCIIRRVRRTAARRSARASTRTMAASRCCSPTTRAGSTYGAATAHGSRRRRSRARSSATSATA